MSFKSVMAFVISSALLVACAGDDGLADETDASPTENVPDAAPVPDAVPGAPDAAPDAGLPPVSFAREIVPILKTRCGGCHLKDMGGAGQLSLGVQAQLAYAAMVDMPTRGAAPACASLKLVNPASADAMKSSLYVKLVGTDCGTRMPKGTPPLPENQLELFARWIAQGAPNN